LGYRVIMFEKDGSVFRDPCSYTQDAVASFSTHDLPTWRGWRHGRDLSVRRELGALTSGMFEAEQKERTESVNAFDALSIEQHDTSSDAIHKFLGSSRAQIAIVQSETALDVMEQPNLPGTTVEYPNWRFRLPVSALDLSKEIQISNVSKIMEQEHRSQKALSPPKND